MIPLFRPALPEPYSWLPIYEEALRTGVVTNFGRVHEAAVEALKVAMLPMHWGASSAEFLPTTSGTAALEVALQLLPKWVTRVAVPEFTFAATAQAVRRAGLQIVVMPCNPETRTFDMGFLFASRGRFDAVVGVVPFGYEFKFELLEQFCAENGKPLVWDMAAAWPLLFPEALCAYSLHAAKGLPIGEGGVVYCPNGRLYEQARRIACFGFDAEKNSNSPVAGNLKLDELRAAVLMAQILRADELVARLKTHRALVARYQEALGPLCQPIKLGSQSFPPLAVLRISGGLPRAQALVEAGKRRGVTFRQYYWPLLSHQPAFNGYAPYGPRDAIEFGAYVAFPSDVSDSEFERVVDLAQDVLSGNE